MVTFGGEQLREILYSRRRKPQVAALASKLGKWKYKLHLGFDCANLELMLHLGKREKNNSPLLFMRPRNSEFGASSSRPSPERRSNRRTGTESSRMIQVTLRRAPRLAMSAKPCRRARPLSPDPSHRHQTRENADHQRIHRGRRSFGTGQLRWKKLCF
jgi:hypothetical protein